MADAAFVAPLNVIDPVPVLESSREPALLKVMVPVALFVEIVPVLLIVPPGMVIVTDEEFPEPTGAEAEMVPELVKVPFAIAREIDEEVPAAAVVERVPLLDTEAELLVRAIVLPVVVSVPVLLKLPAPIVMPTLPAAVTLPALLKMPEPNAKLTP